MSRALVVLVALAACDWGSESLHRRRDPGVLVVAQPSDVRGLDPVRVTDSESTEVGEILFEGLARWKPGTTEVAPGLAIKWTVSDDGLRWTFSLRPGVTFHDGEPLDADAVVFSFERVLSERHPNFLAGEAGAYWRQLFAAVTRVRALDRATVEIDVSRPYAPLLADLAVFPIVSPAAVGRWGDDFQRHPVGTGPFAFESWTPDAQVVVRRFEHYWGQRPALERIVFRVALDARQRLVDLESGSVDLATGILPDELSFVELHPDLRLHHAHSNDVSYLALNCSKPPFSDVRVRQAVAYAINKDPIVKLAFQGRAMPADGPLPPGILGYAPAARMPYDPMRARALLADAARDGAFDPKTVYALYAPSTPRAYLPQPERVARFIQESLHDVGFETSLELRPITAHRDAVTTGKQALALFGWIGDTGDPDNFLFVLFHSQNIAPVGQNVAFWRDAEADKLLVEAQGTVDEATRVRLYARVQEIIAAQVPWVPLAHSELVVAARAELADVKLSPLGHTIYPLIRRVERE